MSPDLPACLIALHPDLLRLARRVASNDAEAQDFAQETLLRLWQRQDSLEEVDDLGAYARTVLRNLHRQARRHPAMQPEESAPEPSAGPAVWAQLALRDLDAAIARLPHDQAVLIRLVAEGETSPKVLAAQAGCPPGTVMSRLARARAQLRHDMGLEDGAPVASLT